MAEAGYPGIQGGACFALFAPAGTPPDVIDPLNKGGREAFNALDIRRAKVIRDAGIRRE